VLPCGSKVVRLVALAALAYAAARYLLAMLSEDDYTRW
jgi:hypothetical protein